MRKYLSEYASLRYNLITVLEDIPWINPYETEKKIDGNKMFQLKIAEKNRLIIPETVFSNNEEKIKTSFISTATEKQSLSSMV